MILALILFCFIINRYDQYSQYVYLRTSSAQAPKHYHNAVYARIIAFSKVLELAIYKLFIVIKKIDLSLNLQRT
jgi:hypothetical protein